MSSDSAPQGRPRNEPGASIASDSRAAPQRLRLFIALELPGAWVDELGTVQRRLDRAAPGFGRWVDPSLFHLTLVFLGEQPETALPVIEGAIETAAAAGTPFQLAAGKLGSFARRRELSVVWMSVEPQPPHALTTLRSRQAAALDQAGVSYASTPFSPHITLARARRDASVEQHNAMARTLTNASWDSPPEPFVCREIVLVRSDLRPGGPIHTPLGRHTLANHG